MQFVTLTGQKYYVNPSDYKIVWAGKSASKFEFNCKKFFYYIWKHFKVCEEFPVQPYLKQNLRCDLINLDLKIACEFHGKQHKIHIPRFHPTEVDFWRAIERDLLKKQTLEKNGFTVVEIYPENYPITLEWLKVKYPKASWPIKYPKI